MMPLAGYVAQAVRDEADAAARLESAIAAGTIQAGIVALADQIDARAFLRVVAALEDAPTITMH